MIRQKPTPRRIDASRISLGEVPDSASVVKDSSGEKIEKLCSHSEWHSRVLWMTTEYLLISIPGEVDVSDQIPLVWAFSLQFRNGSLGTNWHTFQHEIYSSARAEEGHGKDIIWIINTIDQGYNSGRQVCYKRLNLFRHVAKRNWFGYAVCILFRKWGQPGSMEPDSDRTRDKGKEGQSDRLTVRSNKGVMIPNRLRTFRKAWRHIFLHRNRRSGSSAPTSGNIFSAWSSSVTARAACP